MNNFNIFRINCWLDDLDGNNFNQAIRSLIYDIIYNNNNKVDYSSSIYHHINKDYEISLEVDYFNQLIIEDSNINKINDKNDLLIRLTDEKYSELDNNNNQKSIEHYVNLFLKERKYNIEFSDKVCQQLANALYENILIFTTNNIKTILTEKIQNGFSQKDIDIFNEFIEYENIDKNNAIHSTFLKALEFAILTSGKGVKEISEDVFKNKKYYLDTNIIIRLIGVGGFERKDSLNSLLNSCNHEGIKFSISVATEKELKDKIREKCENLRRSINSQSLEVFTGLLSEIGFNYDFETHYGKLVKDGKVNSINKYELLLMNEYENIKINLKANVESIASELSSVGINKFADELLKSKKDDFGVRYTRTAAKVDAINVLGVKKIRGNNNYNYKDIKSFYLTTDRTLNKVLALKSEKNIPETILPSQLFLLHSSIVSPSKEDIVIFTKFIKKRTTEFKINGSDALKYIEEIRDQTTITSELQKFIGVYAEAKYKATSESIKNFNKQSSFIDFALTEIDKRIIELESGNENFVTAINRAIKNLEEDWKKTKFISLFLEGILTLFLSVLIYLFTDKYKGIYFFTSITVINIFLTYSIKNNLKFKLKIRQWLFFKLFVKHSDFSKIFPNNRLYYIKAKEIANIET